MKISDHSSCPIGNYTLLYYNIANTVLYQFYSKPLLHPSGTLHFMLEVFTGEWFSVMESNYTDNQAIIKWVWLNSSLGKSAGQNEKKIEHKKLPNVYGFFISMTTTHHISLDNTLLRILNQLHTHFICGFIL